MARRGLLFVGLFALAAAWLTALPQLAQRAFWAHMTMHMTVVAVAAPLIAIGLAGGCFDPVLKTPKLFAPIPASVVELVVVWAWHAPSLHHAARHSSLGLIIEQGTFLASGLLMWMSAFGGFPDRDGRRSGAGVVGLLLTSMHMTLLGALLALSPRPLYAHIESGARFMPIDDQRLGGAIMLVVGGAAYLAGGVRLVAGLLRGASSESVVSVSAGSVRRQGLPAEAGATNDLRSDPTLLGCDPGRKT